jgi:hypothetical protein
MRFAAETHITLAMTVVKPTIHAGVSPLQPQIARFTTAIYRVLHGIKLFLRGAGQVTVNFSVSRRLIPAFRAPKLPAAHTKRACHVANLTLKRAQQKIMSGVGLRPTNHRPNPVTGALPVTRAVKCRLHARHAHTWVGVAPQHQM